MNITQKRPIRSRIRTSITNSFSPKPTFPDVQGFRLFGQYCVLRNQPDQRRAKDEHLLRRVKSSFGLIHRQPGKF